MKQTLRIRRLECAALGFDGGFWIPITLAQANAWFVGGAHVERLLDQYQPHNFTDHTGIAWQVERYDEDAARAAYEAEREALRCAALPAWAVEFDAPTALSARR